MGLLADTTETVGADRADRSRATAPSGPTESAPPTRPTGARGDGAGLVPAASRAERTTSFDVADFPVPTGREEEWRFTPVRALAPLFAEGATGELRWDAELPEGVTVSRIPEAAARELGILAPQDRPAALAAGTGDATLVDVPVEAELTEPVRIRLTGQGSEAAQGHIVVRTGRHSRATVVVEHQGSAQYSELLSVVSGEGSDLTLVTVQRWDDDAIHVAEHDALVGRDATFRHVAVSLGGRLVRLATNVRYAGPGGDATLLGVYFADAGQHLEHRSFVDHNAPQCASHITYKGALQGENARTVWVGDVLIRAEAEGTDTYEVNRNLVLTEGARADSVPNLEIETGEIAGAGHASATGRFDDLQLFYLQARGIPEDEAKRLVVRGFFADIIRAIPLADLRDAMHTAIEQELAATAYASTDSTPTKEN
ncbi:MAG TPA: Fe-S cluster assembly protein SufD [Intrasporangium sp.]|uniref:Fe-S cluster assembly protein SufD n=1 Tax=Intrasporangium sp. TaxID=1925024 RepID=UPI002D782814|nr:Fe-S cluster assembly protein SufD [Intrasporangium sp.]HET7398061.1 Fe-S cluster assembly protein SufD [Intrasporangium sp.]